MNGPVSTSPDRQRHAIAPRIIGITLLSCGITASVSAFAYAKPATGAPTPVVGGRLAWGFSQTFQGEPRSAVPSIKVGGGATEERNGAIDFPSAGGSYDSASGTATMKYRGTVVIAYPTGSVQVTNPTVAIDRKGAILRADLKAAPHMKQRGQADLGDILMFGIAPKTAARTVTWSQVPTTLTSAGAAAFPAGSLQGDSLGPVTFAATLAVPPGPLANAPTPAATKPGPAATSSSPAATPTDCASPTATTTTTPPATAAATGPAATPAPTDCPSGKAKDGTNGSGGTDGSGTDGSGTGGLGSGDPTSDPKLAKTGGPILPLMLLGLVLTALGAGTMLRARRRAALI